jgi:hypothetical protein
MDLEDGRGILLGHDDSQLVRHVLNLLKDGDYAERQSRLAREQVEQLYSIDHTYRKLTGELRTWLYNSSSDLDKHEANGFLT